jgi:hypothetical protein
VTLQFPLIWPLLRHPKSCDTTSGRGRDAPSNHAALSTTFEQRFLLRPVSIFRISIDDFTNT